MDVFKVINYNHINQIILILSIICILLRANPDKNQTLSGKAWKTEVFKTNDVALSNYVKVCIQGKWF